jgi:hypothetical protein
MMKTYQLSIVVVLLSLLTLAWQWNHNPDNSKWSIGNRAGHLRITTGRVDKDVLSASNMLTQRSFGLFNFATQTAGGFVGFDYYRVSDQISLR